MKKQILISLILGLIFSGMQLFACTNFLVTKGASVDGSTLISYAADSHVLYGELYHWPAASYPEGAMLDVYEWDTGKFLGQIKQAPVTYNVVGNINEHQVAIGETTYGGRSELATQEGAIMDYGSLIYIGLQRSKSAREAIQVITTLMNEYGYASSGESFSISDPNEVWILELIGKGEGEKGGVWVALKIPDGYVSAHANQARIQTFPLADGKKSITFSQIDKINDPGIECVYADDVISFARQKNWFDGKDKEFSFSDTYAPVDFGGARFCEVRVWSFFRSIKDGMDQYFDYASGHNLDNRMPLWIKPDRKISAKDVMDFMRDHLEGTPLDMTQDIGAGMFGNPYRWRPLTWQVDSATYCNERATATQQTGFVFVAQGRSWLPDPIGGILWFGVDDAASTIFVPMYCSITETPFAFAQGNGAMMEFTFESAFWVFNMVSNFTYTRYNVIHPEVKTKQTEMELKFIDEVKKIDAKASEVYKSDKKGAVSLLTKYSVAAGQNTHKEWLNFYTYLFTKYMDGNVKEAVDVPEGYKYHNPKLSQPGYSKEWYKKIVEDTGDKFKMPGPAGH
ncbi:MAG: C69 family dipeptidase [Bacteroidales bacterium]|nr:C69 family dipeptidase [Bacteroidales bacterium]MCF8402566.1 C69 family dipeptidase [Bacteroidales bacterium]